MSACNQPVSARSTIGLLFAPKATIGLGITSTSNSSSQEEARIAIVAPPSMSCSRANFCLDSPSPIYHSSVLPSDSTRLSQTPKSEPYKSIDFVRSNSKTTILDEVAILASKCRGASDTNVFSTTSRVKLPFSVSASGSIFKRYSGLGLGAPPTRRRDSACGDSGASPCWDDDNAILGLGHPPSGSLRAIPPLVSSPTTSLKPLGIGMLASSLSVSSDLCHLASQPPSKLPPRRPQPQPRLHTRTRLISSKMPHLTVSKFTKRLLYTIPESPTSSLFQGHQRSVGKESMRVVRAWSGHLGVRCFQKEEAVDQNARLQKDE
ncbi:hypothetical protein ARMGADRAFT_326458 [Armillaria gallica]|uniref:Uncharacterized protein n=1 Tax=Armillaria gallica TaxID=47427 RepID=A0A2H3DMW7_ARMGA|nr:hypothetical protein ARMGADRAFT_326458 [Armillaria gallica]